MLGSAFFVVMTSVVGGGDLSNDSPFVFVGFPACFVPAIKLGAMVSWWVLFAVDLAGRCALALPTTTNLVLSPLLKFWSPANPSVPFCFGWCRSTPASFPTALWRSVRTEDGGGIVSFMSRRSGVWTTAAMGKDSGGLAEEEGFVGLVWFGLGFYPESDPAVYSLFAGVGPSFVGLTAFWSVRVGSGRCILCFSTGVGFGLLLVFPQCNVSVYGERHGRSLDMGLSPIPKGVCSFAPSGVLKLLTVLVSSPSNGSSFVYRGTLILLWWKNNSRWAPIHEGFILIGYIITISMVVSMTLIILCNVWFV